MESESHTTVAELLTNGSLYEVAPAHLRARLQARLQAAAEMEAGVDATRTQDRAAQRSTRAAPASVERSTGRRWGFLPQRTASWSFVGGIVVGVGLSVTVGASLLRNGIEAAAPQSRATPLEQEIVSSHIRALISARAMDVLSTDQHTVKPWFNGRIDYAPPVVDTRTDGFPLIGARVDYVGGHPVAVLVYRYLKHPIDLYVFPEISEASLTPETTTASRPMQMTKQGYSLVAWHQRGMVYWAITDASMGNLKQFVDAVERLTQP